MSKIKEVEEYFKNLGFTNPIDDIVDKSVIQRNNWFMYGSSKPGKESYKLTKIINIDTGKIYFQKENIKILNWLNYFHPNEDNFRNPCELNDPDFFKEQYEGVFGKPKRGTNKKAIINKTTENLDKIRQLVYSQPRTCR